MQFSGRDVISTSKHARRSDTFSRHGSPRFARLRFYFLEKAVLAARLEGLVAASFRRVRAVRGVCRPK